MSLHERIATTETDPPPWQGPPLRMLPGVVPMERVLVDDEHFSIVLGPMLVYPAGATLVFGVSDKRSSVDQAAVIASEWLRRVQGGFQVHITYPDGRQTRDAPPPDDPPQADEVVLAAQHADGIARDQEAAYWLTPLPPSGIATITVAWPRFGLKPAITRLDGEVVESASRRSRPF